MWSTAVVQHFLAKAQAVESFFGDDIIKVPEAHVADPINTQATVIHDHEKELFIKRKKNEQRILKAKGQEGQSEK